MLLLIPRKCRLWSGAKGVIINFTKLKAYETGNPTFIKKIETRKSGAFQMPAMLKLLRLSWSRVTNFSFMQIIEFPSTKQQQNVFDRINYPSIHRFSVFLFFFSFLFFSFFILRREVLTRLIEASIIDEKQFILNMKFYG